MYLILLCFGTLFGLGAFFLLAGLLRLPTSASTKAVLIVTNRGKVKKNSMNAILFDMAAKTAPLVRMDAYKRRKLEAQLKSAEIQMSPETYVAAAWVKAGVIGLLVIPALLIFPILAPVILFLAVAVFSRSRNGRMRSSSSGGKKLKRNCPVLSIPWSRNFVPPVMC